MRIHVVNYLFLLFSALSVFGQADSAAPIAMVPPLVRFAGALPAANSTIGLTFVLYREEFGGAPLWLETQSVALDSNGRYAVNLGSNHAGGLPAEMFAGGEERWLGVQPEGQPEQPRVLLVSVPYAMRAADADSLGGRPASWYVTREQLNNLGAAPALLPTSDLQRTQVASGAPDSVSSVTPAPCSSVTSDGSALANYLTRFTTPCNIENSGLYQSAAGYLGIGTTAPIAPLDLEFAAQTGTTGSIFGEHLISSFNPVANSAASSYALFGQASTGAGNAFNFTGDLIGGGFIVEHSGTGTLSTAYGANFSVLNHSTGTIASATSFYGLVSNQSTGTITNGYGLFVAPPQNVGGGSFTNFYGAYISNPTGAANGWGLYTLAAKNYVSGDLGIGTTAPAHPLDVVGTGNFTGGVTALSFAGSGAALTALSATNLTTGTVATARGGTGLTNPGTAGEYLRSNGTTWAASAIQKSDLPGGVGTITGVTAGIGLTGGGTSGSVALALPTCANGQALLSNGTTWACTNLTGGGTITGVTAGTDLIGGGSTGTVALKLDTSKVPQLAAANAFTNTQSVAPSAVGSSQGATGMIANGGNTLDVSGAGGGTALNAFGGANTGYAGPAVGGTGVIATGGPASLSGQYGGVGMIASGGDTSNGSFGNDGVQAYGSSGNAAGNFSGGNGVSANGGTGAGTGKGGAGIEGTGGNAGASAGSGGGAGGYFVGGGGGTGGALPGFGIAVYPGSYVSGNPPAAAGFFAGQVWVQSNGGSSMPQAYLEQQNSSDYSRLRFLVDSESNYWDIEVGGAANPAMNLVTAGTTALSLTPFGSQYMLMGNGASLTTGGVWANNSDRNLKTEFAAVDGADLLARLQAVPMSSWKYKSETGARHLGPMAQDFYAAFGLGDDNRHISTVDEGGVALIAIQELYRQALQKDMELRRQSQQIEILSRQVAELSAAQSRMAALESRLMKLEADRQPVPATRLVAKTAQATRVPPERR